MNTKTMKTLAAITKDFYVSQSASFSETRQAPWTGWHRCADAIAHACGDVKDRKNVVSGLTLLDLACGNLRFEKFLCDRFPETHFEFYAVDDCTELVGELAGLRYQNLDVMETLLQENTLAEYIDASPCDVSASFGFMHHIPRQENRLKVLQALVEKTYAGGLVMVSFWQFLQNDDLAKKAAITHEQARAELQLPELDDGDFLLGWKNEPGIYRYCHSFSEREIDELIAALPQAEIIDRFTADGRTENLNTYLIFRVR